MRKTGCKGPKVSKITRYSCTLLVISDVWLVFSTNLDFMSLNIEGEIGEPICFFSTTYTDAVIGGIKYLISRPNIVFRCIFLAVTLGKEAAQAYHA